MSHFSSSLMPKSKSLSVFLSQQDTIVFVIQISSYVPYLFIFDEIWIVLGVIL